MGNDAAPDWEQDKAKAARAEQARQTTLARAEHVWVRQDYYSGTEWRHGLLLGWIRWQYGTHPPRLMGRVLIARMSWNQWTGDWETSWWEQLVEPDKIRLARSVPMGREQGE